MADHVHVTVAGYTGSGKSRITLEIETALRAIGVAVTWSRSEDERVAHDEAHSEATGGYQPELPAVVLSERNWPRPADA